MLLYDVFYVCPKCGNNRFYTSVQVVQNWIVDDEGNLHEISDICVETLGGPDRSNSWCCTKCFKSGVDIKKSCISKAEGEELECFKEEYSKWLRIHSAQMGVSERVLEIMLKREEDRRELEEG